MSAMATLRFGGVLLAGGAVRAGSSQPLRKPPTLAEVLAATTPGDWRALDPENTLYVELAAGRVVIELAPAFAPQHVANVKALVREGYFDGLAIIRSQDNYVVQWGDPDGERRAEARGRSARRSATLAGRVRPRRSAPSFRSRRCPTATSTRPRSASPTAFPAARDPKSRPRLARPLLRHARRGPRQRRRQRRRRRALRRHRPRAAPSRPQRHAARPRACRGWSCSRRCRAAPAPMGFYEKRRAARAHPRDPRRRRRARGRAQPRSRCCAPTPRPSRRSSSRAATAARSGSSAAAGHIELCNVPLPVRARSGAAP